MRPLLAFILLCVLSGGVLAQDDARFPPLTAENLEERQYDLPGDFEGRYNALVIAYKREQQVAVDTWFGPLREMAAEDDRLHYYELPVISGTTGFFMGWIIDRGMRRGIPEREKRERVITIYTDKDAFKSALALPESEETIRILLVDREGRVLWRGDGPFTEAQGAALRERLSDLP